MLYHYAVACLSELCLYIVLVRSIERDARRILHYYVLGSLASNFTCMSFVQVGNQKTVVGGAADANIADTRQRKTGTDKAYPQSLKCSMLSSEPLKANCRGVVPLTSTSEKPVISAEEFIENRRRGMSYASIGKKLGIDPSKEKVLSVYKILKEVDDDFLDVKSEDITVPKQYPAPLWFL